MNELAIAIALLSAVVLLGAWHTHRTDNRRDARLMAGLGASGVAGAVVLATI